MSSRPLATLFLLALPVPALGLPAFQRTRAAAGPAAGLPAREAELPAAPALAPGTVRQADILDSLTPGFEDELDWGDSFGRACARLGDLDGDGVDELAIGSDGNPGGPDLPRGRIWILFRHADGSPNRYQKISITEGGFTGMRTPDQFASALAGLGDVDGDGVPDLAVGAPFDSENGRLRGALWILFLRSDGTVKSQQKISDTQGGFGGRLDDEDTFGAAVAGLGDVDGDGVPDLAVGAPGDDDSRNFRFDDLGAVWLLFLRPNGTVRGQRKISDTSGQLPLGMLGTADHFGRSLAALGDRDGDGTPDLAVGSVFWSHFPAVFGSGAVYLLHLSPVGNVNSVREISERVGGFQGGTEELLGAHSIASVGDLDGDGVGDLAVGSNAFYSSAVPDSLGVVRILFLNADGTVRSQVEIGADRNGFTGPLTATSFGAALANLGDLDGDGHLDLLVGQPQDKDDPVPVTGGIFLGRGAVWFLSLASDGTVLADHKSGGAGEEIPIGTLDPGDAFGAAAETLGDLDGDGFLDLAVGSPGDDSGGLDRGAVWVLFLDGARHVRRAQRIGALDGGFSGALDDGDGFGGALARLGDLDGDGRPELAVGASGDDDGDLDRGAVWVLSLNADGTVYQERKISSLVGNLGASLARRDGFGAALAAMDDLDRDGVADLAVGAPGSLAAGETSTGRAFVLLMRSDGSVAATRELVAGPLRARDRFGKALVSPGDVDHDGVDDLVVGAAGDDDGATDQPQYGAVWLLFLRSDGSVRELRKIGRSQFPDVLQRNVLFGSSVAAPGDLDGDGTVDLAVGGPQHEAPDGFDQGAVWILFLASDGGVSSTLRIDAHSGGFPGTLRDSDRFGFGLFAGVDLDGDGVRDLLVGSSGNDAGGTDEGALWCLELAGTAVVDFRHGDDLALTPLANGLALPPNVGFRRTLQLSSYGANRGPALFDSRSPGPNQSSQDRDLLVGRDQLLILQNDLASTQSVPGYYDRPNDDENGGTLLLRFVRGPVEPLSLVLVDIDPGSLQDSEVVLVDSAGRTRTYCVPAGWTEDLLQQGPPAYRTLDLTTLDPQPGFAATATAFEQPGFLPQRVMRVEVRLGSSGAVDDLRWRPHPGE